MKRRWSPFLLGISFGLFGSGEALAQTAQATSEDPLGKASVEAPPPRPSEEAESTKCPVPGDCTDVSITFSPLHLFMPIFELTVEAKISPHFGAALIGGYGSVTLEDEIDGSEITLTSYEIGGQVVGYPIHDFDSLQLGIEGLWVHVDLPETQTDTATISGTGAGFAVGPFVGYKLITSPGFTFFGQLGAQYIAVTAEARADGESSRDRESRIIPLLNLNAGWSF